MNDIQVGRTMRALRHRAHLTQAELAARTGVSQATVSLLERGHIGGMGLGTARRIVAGLDAEIVLIPTWRGGDLARLLDARHADLCEATARMLDGRGWAVVPELSYSEFGERGSIDLVGWHASTSTLLIIEVKTEITSVEETLRKHDAKARLGPRIVQARFGWRAATTARLLVLPEHRTIRRQIEDKRAVFGRAYPERTVAMRAWLRAPGRPTAGLMFLSDSNVGRGMRGSASRKRVRVARSSVDPGPGSRT